MQVGFGYGIGIVLALVIAASTSGGHFNPCITICFAIFKGFPWKKVPQRANLAASQGNISFWLGDVIHSVCLRQRLGAVPLLVRKISQGIATDAIKR